MPFQAVFMQGGAGYACMDDLVVNRGASSIRGRLPHYFACPPSSQPRHLPKNNVNDFSWLRIYHLIRGNLDFAGVVVEGERCGSVYAAPGISPAPVCGVCGGFRRWEV